MIRRPPRSTQSRSSAASDVYKRQGTCVSGARPGWMPGTHWCGSKRHMALGRPRRSTSSPAGFWPNGCRAQPPIRGGQPCSIRFTIWNGSSSGDSPKSPPAGHPPDRDESGQRRMKQLLNATIAVDGVDERGARVWRREQFQDLLDSATGEIGRVVSSEKEPAGAHQYFFWAADDALTLDVGHIVVAFSEEAAVIGVVDEPRRYSDLRSFLDDYFDRHVELALAADNPTQRPEILVYTVKVLSSKHRRADVQSQRPVINGPVYFATEAAIEFALGTHGFSGARVPALMHTNGNYVRTDTGAIETDERGLPKFQRTPLYLDEDYLVGPEAGHANWTGQSGLATKTSHALFLIGSVFQTMRNEGKSVAAIMFNVKGPDLLWLDKPAQPAPELEDAYAAAGSRVLGQSDLEAYAAFGIDPKPFDNMRIFAPFRLGS